MCGILGVIGNPVNKERFIQSLDLQLHRGPDDYGYHQEPRLQFGHRRLSIIDVSHHSSQPMVAGMGDLVGVFNGEIYNYRELRSELEQAGYRFKTNGDTEVLLNGYHYYGESILPKLIGMFAFSIYDRRNKQVFLARDRLGIKPLYYTKNSNNFVFSSEVKSILKLDERERDLNNTAVSAYLSYRYPILNDTFYEGIYQLAPGHCMRVNTACVYETKLYWSLAEVISHKNEDLGEQYYLEQVQEIFRSSVKYRMISDVPVGAYLSGGVDSSAVVAEMAKASTSSIKTFTIGFEDEGYNEFEYARIVADQYKTDHHEIILGQDDYVSTMEELIKYKGAPLGVPNEVPLFRMSQELKKHVTVVLSGEGADEIFAGYGRIFRSADDYEKITQSINGECSPALAQRIKAKYGTRVFKSEVDHFLHLYRYTSVSEKNSIFHNRFVKQKIEPVLDHRFHELFLEAGDSNYVNKMMYIFEKLHLPGLLQRVDVTTMAASVEARVPFVDHRLVECAFNIPDKYKLRWKSGVDKCNDLLGGDISEVYDTPKYILKKAMEPLLPDSILYRPKMGFPVPLDRWFGGDFKRFAANQVLSGELVRREVIDKGYVASLFKSDRMEKQEAVAKTAWMLLSLELFLKQF